MYLTDLHVLLLLFCSESKRGQFETEGSFKEAANYHETTERPTPDEDIKRDIFDMRSKAKGLQSEMSRAPPEHDLDINPQPRVEC